ncbi:fetuin-B [Protopterus annectens]|uniref:fetuin-B n=1 Tax=Protopterus annectens TaxID=7888 RepID=UPI001CFB9018|nr:fetuin-B [Protopterus annectens]
MKQLNILLTAVHLFCTWTAVYPSPPPSMMGYLSCNDSLAKTVSNLALEQINKNRTEGYIYSLFRISSVLEELQAPFHSLYYLTLDVEETECHVLSKMISKNCPVKPLHLAVFGTCEATLYINKPARIVRLYNSNCTLTPVPRSQIFQMCPDCPAPVSVDDEKVIEAANKVLQKFNNENNHIHYFGILSLTAASMQWVVGPSYFVEFLIKETPCSKMGDERDLSKCTPIACPHATTGLCKGSVMSAPDKTYITASCEFFNRTTTDVGEHQCPIHGIKPMPHPVGPHHPHGSKQDEHKPMPLPVFPHEDHSAEKGEHKPATLPFFPPGHGDPHHKRPFFEQEPQVRPFPHGPSESSDCPGEPVRQAPMLLRLLPGEKPVEEEHTSQQVMPAA